MSTPAPDTDIVEAAIEAFAASIIQTMDPDDTHDLAGWMSMHTDTIDQIRAAGAVLVKSNAAFIKAN